MRTWRAMGLMIGAALVLPAIQPTAAGELEQPAHPILLENAQGFRESMGWAHDSAFVASTFSDPQRSSEAWGIPLNAEELADLQARIKLSNAFDSVLERAIETEGYAGAMLDQKRGGRPVVFTTNPTALDQDLASAAQDSLNFDVHIVRNSLAELLALKARILDDLPELEAAGLEIVSVGPDVLANKIVLGVTGLTEATEAWLRSRYGSEVLVEEDRASTADACNTGSCWPMKGGLKIYHPGYEATRYCTSGFMARRNDNDKLVMLTAGHCLALYSNTSWAHAGNTLGTELSNSWFNGADADIGAIQLNATALNALTGSVKVSHYSDTPLVNYEVHSGTPSLSQITGHLVCRVGWRTYSLTGQGRTCGIVGTQTNVTRKSCEQGLTINCRMIDHQWEVNFDSLPGDSGGPVTKFVDSPSNGLTAYGTHTHSGSGAGAVGWYSPWQWSQVAYANLSLGYNINLCFTSLVPPCTT